MFDRHEIVYSEGVPTESFCSGEEAMNVLESETRNEILDLLPEIACENLDQFALARVELKGWEVNFLREA